MLSPSSEPRTGSATFTATPSHFLLCLSEGGEGGLLSLISSQKLLPPFSCQMSQKPEMQPKGENTTTAKKEERKWGDQENGEPLSGAAKGWSTGEATADKQASRGCFR